MNKTSKREEELLGDVATVVAGGQYCDADAKPGEKLTMEREPGNTHDARAVRLENERFEKIGYLPRRIASWLAPLQLLTPCRRILSSSSCASRCTTSTR